MIRWAVVTVVVTMVIRTRSVRMLNTARRNSITCRDNMPACRKSHGRVSTGARCNRQHRNKQKGQKLPEHGPTSKLFKTYHPQHISFAAFKPLPTRTFKKVIALLHNGNVRGPIAAGWLMLFVAHLHIQRSFRLTRHLCTFCTLSATQPKHLRH